MSAGRVSILWFLLCLLLMAPPLRARDEEAFDEDEEAEVEDEEPIEIDPEIFEIALKDFYAKRFADAAAGFWGYVHFGEPSVENYEWAQYFLAESMRGLGLWHAAVQYYYIVAKTRSRPEILPDALRRLEAISRRRPFSETLVFDDLIYDSEFGSLPSDVAQWVAYIQGLYDFRHGFDSWGELHFEKIPEDTYYGLRALYVRAVDALRQKRDDKALTFFETIIDSNVDAPDIKNKAHLAFARLLFDNGRYREALQAYDKVEQIDLSFEQAELLLEKAWANYYLEEHRKAMGLLHALEAPSYEKFFLPDAYVLRGLILKELCHYLHAKRVSRNFRFAYQRSLDDLRRRIPMYKIPRILDGATQEGTIARRTAFIKALEKERRIIEDYDSQWEDVELDKHLRRLYEMQMREQARLWKIEFKRAADDTALYLLDTEEQINLLDYEIGLDIFKRLKMGAMAKLRQETLVIPYDSANVYYEFDTEYWNDELHTYQYFVTSRCFEAEKLE